MAKPNYALAKRQRDVAKKAKKEEKRMKKAETSGTATKEGASQPANGTVESFKRVE